MNPDPARIYLSPPHLDGRERELLLQAFESNWITTLGPQVDAFERDMCAFTGAGHAVAVASGTAAIHLALILLEAGPGDDVLCSDLTFAATANPIVYQGARPVFIDSERSSWNLDPALLEEELRSRDAGGRRPKAVIAVDLYGQCADYDAVRAVCDRFGVPLIEDAAEALGATYRGRPAGRFGRLGVFSFNGNKIITTSGGGMLVADDPEPIAAARFLATQARDPAPHYQHSRIGYNYRLSNLLAAVGRAQLETLPDKLARRREINALYRRELLGLPGLEFLPEAAFGTSNHWLTVVLITPEAFGADRETVRLALEAERIEARPVWKPMHMQPVFSGCPVRGGGVSEDLFRRGLCLPSGSRMSDADVGRVSRLVRSRAAGGRG